MFKIVFLVTLVAFHAFTWGSKNFWLDDIDGPKFLRGIERQTNLQKKTLDDTNVSPVAIQTIMPCGIAEHSNGVITTPWNEPPVDGLDPGMRYSCGTPHPTVVEFKDPSAGIHPSAIVLHRCVGGCFQQLIENCTVTSQEEVTVSVFKINGGFTNITVYNHTGCDCDCKTRSENCDNKTQTHDAQSCSCKCKETGSSCDPAKQNWNGGTCQCECKMAPGCDLPNTAWNDTTCQCECTLPPLKCGKNMVWNIQTCQCDLCAQRVKDRCVRKGKVLNTAKCECECPTPLPVCSGGTTFLKHNCTCV